VGVRRLHAFPGVALARDQRERPGVGRDEVRARHADLSVENLLAEVPTGESRQFLCGFERLVRLEHLVEQGRDLLAGLVNGRSDNVRGCLVGDLQDELGEVGLPDVRAAGFEGVVHFELLASHRLRFHHVPAVDDIRDVSVRVGGVVGDINGAAVVLDRFGDLVDEFGEALDGVLLDLASLVFEGLVVVEVRRGFVPPLVEHLRVLVDAVALGVEEVADVSGFPLAVSTLIYLSSRRTTVTSIGPVCALYEPAHIRGGARSGRDDGLPGAAADVLGEAVERRVHVREDVAGGDDGDVFVDVEAHRFLAVGPALNDHGTVVGDTVSGGGDAGRRGFEVRYRRLGLHGVRQREVLEREWSADRWGVKKRSE